MAGFETGSLAKPQVEGEVAAARYLATVPRSIPSFRAMSRPDVPLWAKTMIACCKFTLSWFIAPLCGSRRPQRNAALKVAGFHSTLSGWF